MEKKIHLLTFDEIDSTNEWAKRNILQCPKDKITCIVAKTQTSGKGRWTRKWHSKPGNLYASFCLFSKDEENISHMGQILAVAAAKILQQFSLKPLLKWPNDIWVSEKKIGGILTETSLENGLFFVIVGIGLNVNMRSQDAEKIDQAVTSIFLETGKQTDPIPLLSRIASQFLEEYDLLEKKGFSSCLPFFNDHLAFKNKRISFEHLGKENQGRCLRVNEEGRLEIALDSGEILALTSGEIKSVKSLDLE